MHDSSDGAAGAAGAGAPQSGDASPRAASGEGAPASGGLFAEGRSLIGTFKQLIGELPGLWADRIELLSLEMIRAGRALTQAALLIVAVAILGVTAWLGAWAVVVLALIDLGLPAWLALLIAIAVNALVALIALRMALARVKLVGLPATRRHLTLHTLQSSGSDPSVSAADGRPSQTATPGAAAASAAAASASSATASSAKPEDESADPVGDGRSDARYAAGMPHPASTPQAGR